MRRVTRKGGSQQILQRAGQIYRGYSQLVKHPRVLCQYIRQGFIPAQEPRLGKLSWAHSALNFIKR
jgi:hypothetical protein